MGDVEFFFVDVVGELSWIDMIGVVEGFRGIFMFFVVVRFFDLLRWVNFVNLVFELYEEIREFLYFINLFVVELVIYFFLNL